MTKAEIIEKAKATEETIAGLDQLRELENYVSTNDCGCATQEEWKQLVSALDNRRKQVKAAIKNNR